MIIYTIPKEYQKTKMNKAELVSELANRTKSTQAEAIPHVRD
jgi:hypothetical protein